MNLQKLFLRKYDYDVTLIKEFGFENNLKKYKVITMNVLRSKGIEEDNKYNSNNRCKVNNEKLQENIIRARNRIFELAFCNKWQYFFTGTLDKKKYNREDLDKFHKDFTRFIRLYNKKNNLDIKFLIIPELHKDKKSWHFHGLINNLPQEQLKLFEVGDKMGKKLLEKVINGDTVYNWIDYKNKFGFCDLEPIKNKEALSKYITKYITKELAFSVTKLNAQLYYHSRGLNFAKEIKKGHMSWGDIQPDYKNDYCKISWISSDKLNSFLNRFI